MSDEMKLTVTFGDRVLFSRDVNSCTTEETASGTFTVAAAFPAVEPNDPTIWEGFEAWASKTHILDNLIGDVIVGPGK